MRHVGLRRGNDGPTGIPTQNGAKLTKVFTANVAVRNRDRNPGVNPLGALARREREFSVETIGVRSQPIGSRSDPECSLANQRVLTGGGETRNPVKRRIKHEGPGAGALGPSCQPVCGVVRSKSERLPETYGLRTTFQKCAPET